jgi:D-alanyl-D-alanine dipeptidase
MTAAGFDFYRNEWWHYQLFSPRGRYPVLSDSVLAKPMMDQRTSRAEPA